VIHNLVRNAIKYIGDGPPPPRDHARSGRSGSVA